MLISRQPSRHAATHQNGGSDEIAATTPAANAIPKAGAGGTLAVGWLPLMGASGGSHAAGAVPDPGSSAGSTRFLREDSTWAVPATSSLPRGYIDGLVLANISATSQGLSIAGGACRDGANAQDIATTAVYYKTLAGTWLAGAGSSGSPKNGLDAGSVAANTWYHVWAISDGTNSDFLFSASATAPSLPGGYTAKRRIGAVLTTNDANKYIVQFSQRNDQFLWRNVVNDYNAASLGTTATAFTLTVPTGIQVDAILSIGTARSASATVLYAYSPDVADEAASASGPTRATVQSIAAGQGEFCQTEPIRTNTSAQIRAVCSLATSVFYCGTMGWIDTRGRNE